MFQLHHAECLQQMASIPDKSIDLILCDLPYGTTACSWDSAIALDPLWKQYRRIVKDRAAIVLTAVQPFTSALGASNLNQLAYQWYWKKSRPTGHLNAKKMPMKEIEDILVFGTSLPRYYPQGLVADRRIVKNSNTCMSRGISTGASSTVTGGIIKQEYTQEFTNYPRQLLEIPSESKTVHPTQKPVALMEYLIRTYTNPDDLVLDNCMGSGTTGVACGNTGRRFIGIEQDAKYFDIARQRIVKAFCSSPSPHAA